MTDTYTDRLFAAVLDEVRDPSMPRFGEDPVGMEPSLDSGAASGAGSDSALLSDSARGGVAVLLPRRSRMKTVAGIAAAVVLLAGGGALILNQETRTRVKTVELGGTATEGENGADGTPIAETTYLTFGDPVGTVYRNARRVAELNRFVFRPTSVPDQRFYIGPGMAESDLNSLTEVGAVGERRPRSLTTEESGGKPFGVYFWKEADGSTWALSTYDAAVGDVVDAAGEADRWAMVEAFLSQLSYADGDFTVGPGFEQIQPLDEALPEWSISDDRRELAMIAGRQTSALSTVTGERTTVRGHSAVFTGRDLYWEESAGEILKLSVKSADPRYDDGGPSTTLGEVLGFAEALAHSTRDSFNSLKLLRGQIDERVVLVLPDGVPSLEAVVEFIRADEITGTMYQPVGPDGVSLDTTGKSLGDISGGTLGFWIWASSSTPTSSSNSARPSCAQKVMIPPPDEPTVTVVLDTNCTK